jgi:hypothetical protein
MYVFPASHFKVHAANKLGLAGEQSALSGAGILSRRRQQELQVIAVYKSRNQVSSLEYF